MGQFKPMVKMMTTEPSVELKLKKGGHVNMKKGGHAKDGHKSMPKMMDGGVMGALANTPALVGRPAVNAPVRTPGKPPMAMRRKAMMPVRPARPMGMMKEGGETSKEHMAEMRKMASTAKELKKHESMPASKAHKGLKTGGVAMGNAGGFKKGGKVKMAEGGLPKSGIINTEDQGGAYRNTKMHTAEGEDHTPKKTGEVVMGKPGGYKAGGKTKKYAKGGGVEGNVSTTPPGKTNTTTGEVKLGNAGGYKKGGSPKKAFATGGLVDTGRPVAMPRKPASKPVSNDRQSGTFKKGGKVGCYDDGGKVPAEIQSQLKTNEANRAFKNFEKSEREENEAMRESILGAPGRVLRGIKGLFSSPPSGSVTKTKESVTVSKKRGGAMC